ncbi:hypothetical protein AVEN_234633-1 [Araneus ventricosus]|uniref:Uncharacterized protein n=1 Tax=Araneus ventricosus TaxID=182803 RepID=A0A4Y2CZG1_ARAVE|nr:hypothetical protein AVEN_234633-1 [Araneus ventricosus]
MKGLHLLFLLQCHENDLLKPEWILHRKHDTTHNNEHISEKGKWFAITVHSRNTNHKRLCSDGIAVAALQTSQFSLGGVVEAFVVHIVGDACAWGEPTSGIGGRLFLVSVGGGAVSGRC